MIVFADPKKQYLSYKTEIKEKVLEVLDSGQYILGEEVKKFEKEFAAFTGVNYAIGVSNGTDAIFLSLKALEVGLGDEVITVSHTAVPTVSAIEATGAKAVFVDIEEDFFTIDTSKIEDKITPKTKAIVAVHLYGQVCNMTELLTISKKNNLFLIEDCAQAHGTIYNNKKVGSIGNIGTFSFFPTKNLGALGDGGAITTNSKVLYEKLLMLRQYGWDKRRESQFQGYNSRLDELQAAILRVKLKYLNKDIKKRNHIAELYIKHLKGCKYTLPKIRYNTSHSFHLFVIKTKKRNELKEFLIKNNVIPSIHYEKAVHMQKAYKRNNKLPITEKIIYEILSLPIYPELKEEEILYITKLLKDFEYKELND